MKSISNNEINNTNNNNNSISHLPNNKKTRKENLELSPDSEKFEKYLKEFNYYLNENKKNEKILIKIFSGFLEFSKKSKYQINILESNELMETIKDILINPKSNIEILTKASEIIMNISKNENIQAKLIDETCFNFNSLFQILLININSQIVGNLLMTFLYLTKSNDILIYLQENNAESDDFEEDDNYLNLNELNESHTEKMNKLNKLMSKLKLKTIARTLSEQILDGLISSNKKIVLEILYNLYSFDDSLINKESIEPLVRCLGDKNNDVIINGLKILLFFTKNKSFHNDLLKDNFIFRLVRAYKQGIDEMDIIIVKILYDLFDNKNLYEILFKNNVLLMLSNYLMNFEVEKNEKYEEVIRNVFEIFKLIIKNTEEENNKLSHLIQNPIIEDENLQILIFKKAYSLAAISKNEESILSCLSLIYIMLSKFTSTLLYSNDSVKSIIELVPPFFKFKKLEIIRYSLCIFEIILNKKGEYFQQEFITSNNQNFSIKSLVNSVVNLVNDFSGHYELLRMSCRILVTLSSIIQLQSYFLQEPQITVLKVFIDNLLKSQRILNIEEKEYENSYEESNSNNIHNNLFKNPNNSKINYTPNLIINKASNMPSPFKLGGTQNKIGIQDNKKGRKTSDSYHLFTGSNGGMISSNNEEKDKNYILDIKNKKAENISLLKDCFTVISNLGKNVDNLEVLRLKGFLDVITDKLDDNDTEILPYIIRCIQGFCQEQSCIDNILRNRIINKILNIYKLYRSEDEKIRKNKNDSNAELENVNQVVDKNIQEERKVSQWITTAKRLEVLKSLKIILESDIKLQRTFIIERGIEILLNDIINNPININESVSEQLNEMILRVIYVVSCNINKLFLIYFNNGEKIKKKKNDDNKFNSSNNDSNSFSDDKDSKIKNNKSFSSLDSKDENNNKNEKELILGENEVKEENNIKEDDVNNNKDNNKLEVNNEISKISKISNDNDNDNSDDNLKDINNNINKQEKVNDKLNKSKNSNKNLFKIFSEQLSEEKFMNKLTEVGMYEKNNSNTYKELIKIFINLYLNRFYLEYFTYPKNFNKVIKIITKILKKYKENSINSYEILKLIVIFLKFICEEERLIKKFLKEDVISILIAAIIENDFYKNIKEEETKQFYYNFSLVLLRLTEFNGYIDKFETFQDFFKILEKLYEINSINGKIYIISIIRNIIAEKQDFFEELDLSRFLNKVVSQKNTLIVFEFVELIKNLVHSRSMCKRMESVFRYLINEIKLECYSSEFKKKMLDLILCLSYENSNIKDYSLQDLLTLIKNFDINMTQKTTLLLLMNFSSLSNNFEFLMQDYKENNKKSSNNDNKEKKVINLTKKDFIQVVNQLINSDRFSQILIQRLLINITSIEGIDISIISQKIIKVLIEILTKSNSLQDNIIIFSLATLVNIINRNVLRFEELNINNKSNLLKEESNDNKIKNIDDNGYLSGIESNEVLLSESNSENENKKNKKSKKIDDFQLSDNEEDFDNNNKKEKNKNSLKEQIKKKSLIELKKLSKKGAKSILKKKNNENTKNKKAVEIKTINEENQKEEESSVKETEKEKEKDKGEKEEEKNNGEDYKPLQESEKEVTIVDYIIENVPNLIDIIKGLFNKGSIDISSLTIMFCCNLIRKIRFSKYNKLESEFIKCVDNYIQNEKLLNSNDSNQALLNSDNGKFLLIALIKYFICLSIEDIDQFNINNLNKSNITNIIISNIKEPTLNLKKLKVFKLAMNDIRENSINCALVENQLNLINYILLLTKQKNIKYYFGYRNQNEIKEYFEIFYESFIKNFSVLLNNIIKDDEEQQKLNNMNKVKEDSDNENNNNEETSNRDKNNNEKDEQNSEREGTISKNQTIQNIIISLLKILIEFFVDFDYFNKYPEDKERSLLSKKDLNITFYNKISKYFESILQCVIKEKTQYLHYELKNLFTYILYLILTNNIEKIEPNATNYSLFNNNSSKTNTIRSSLKKQGNTKYKLETNIENDINIFKWLIKLFIENTINIQNDFFSIKLFALLIYNDKFPYIFHEEEKFIKKLLYFLKYNGENEIQNILKIESERFLNILSFNYDSHQNLYIEGVYKVFKSNLYIKVANNKKINQKMKNSKIKSNKKNKVGNSNDELCNKEDYILLVNMVLNNNNKEFIKDDIKNILSCVLPSKELPTNVKYELFNIFLNVFIINTTSNHFQEDFQYFFDLLFNNIASDFSETLFFYDKLVYTYKNFSKKYLLTDDKLNTLFNQFVKFDNNILSKKEEFVTYLKMLELRLNQNNISEKLEKIFKKLMIYSTNEKTKDKLKDINVLNSLLNFSFLFFLKYTEKKNFLIINENDDALNEDNDIEIEDDKNKNENEEENFDDYDESSSGDSIRNYGLKVKNKNALKEIKLRIKKNLKNQLKHFIINYKYSELIDIIIYNSFHYDDLRGINILSMLLIQEDYKLILIPLKEIGNNIFKKEFFFNLFQKFLNSKSIDVKEFSFFIHLFIVISNVDSKITFSDSISDIISTILEIYDKFLLKYLTNSKNNNNNNTGLNSEDNKDNGAANGGNNENQNEEKKNDNLLNNLSSNLFNDTVTSLYFFCDLIKVNNIGHKDLEKILTFMIKIISDIKGFSVEQKEILIRYYQEILLNYDIISSDDLFNVHFPFLRKIHKDNAINFIEHLIFGTILINTKKRIITNSIKEFLDMVTLICLHNELNFNDMDKKMLLNFYNFVKQICLILSNKDENEEKIKNENNNNMNNGKEEDDLETKIKISFSTIETYSNKINKKYSSIIKKDEDLNKKFKKLKQIINDCANS